MRRLEILVAYDVATDTPAGRRRLQRVAHVCEAFGQRVQKSVFECVLNDVQFERLLFRLQKEIDEREDSLRIYRLSEPRSKYLRVLGREPIDLRGPLVL